MITRNEFLKYIKPLEDNVYSLLESNTLSSSESIMITDALIRITKKLLDPSKLLKELNNLTPLQIEILEKHNLVHSINEAKNFLSNRNTN